jgi:hypothetical protein
MGSDEDVGLERHPAGVMVGHHERLGVLAGIRGIGDATAHGVAGVEDRGAGKVQAHDDAHRVPLLRGGEPRAQGPGAPPRNQRHGGIAQRDRAARNAAFDFRLVGAHIKPDDAWDELAAL